MRELRKYSVDIACLSEVRMADCGHSVIKVLGEGASYNLYHSGVIDNTGRYGVAIALGEATQAALLAWMPISSRFISARPKRTTVNLTVIAVYALTPKASKEGTTPGSQRLLVGNCGRDREGGGLC